jgi:hypothetical protein
MYEGTPTIYMILYDVQTRIQTRRKLLSWQKLLHPVLNV